jgi:DegV family protein with EDD domain
MWVTIGGRQYRDGDLGMDEVLGRLGEGISTSGPAPGELAEAIAGADNGDGVVVLTISRNMSGVYQAAVVAAGTLEGGKVAVVDTRTAAGAEGLVVLAAARAARAGLPLSRVVPVAREAAAGTRLLATLPSLEHLARSGRVPGAAAWGARWLGLDPVFEFRAGRVHPMLPARGRELACRRIVAELARDAGRRSAGGASLHVAAMHALEPGVARDMLADVGGRARPAAAFTGSFSPVMVAHTGPGLVGLAWLWQAPAGSA